MPDPLLKRIGRDELPAPLQRAHDRSMALRGDATFFEVFGNNPELFAWYTGSFYGEVFRGGRVERRIKELVRLRLSIAHGCRFCNQGNRVDALEAGITGKELEQLHAYDTGHFSEKEKAALRLADMMKLTNAEGVLTTEIYDSLADHFDDAEILELGMVLGVLCGMARFMFAYDLVEKEANCPFPVGGHR